MCENHTGKCLCQYCSGSIGRGMKDLNEKYVLQSNQLVDNFNNSQENFNELSLLLDHLNPVQCFDILDKLCSKNSSTTENFALDELILKFIIRYRNNGGFFLALKEPSDHRQFLLKRLIDTILINNDNAQKANLTPSDIY